MSESAHEGVSHSEPSLRGARGRAAGRARGGHGRVPPRSEPRLSTCPGLEPWQRDPAGGIRVGEAWIKAQN